MIAFAMALLVSKLRVALASAQSTGSVRAAKQPAT
jgi:hypothetical protein